MFQQLNVEGGVIKKISSSSIKVGDFIILNPNERAPADMVIIWTSDPSGSIFIRTDQLDGETDWKVKRPLTSTQNHIGQADAAHPFGNLSSVSDLYTAVWQCEQPNKKIYDFLGLFEHEDA